MTSILTRFIAEGRLSINEAREIQLLIDLFITTAEMLAREAFADPYNSRVKDKAAEVFNIIRNIKK